MTLVSLRSEIIQLVRNYSKLLEADKYNAINFITCCHIQVLFDSFTDSFINVHLFTWSSKMIPIKKTYNFSFRIFNYFYQLKGRSDTIFAKIIDKMILPYGLKKTSNLKAPSANNLTRANNQNSILISLKDTLHLVCLKKREPIIYLLNKLLKFL